MPALGIITALRIEAGCLGRPLAPEITLDVSGPGPGPARAAAERLVARGCDALLSLGLAGGLDPALDAGAVVIAENIVDGAGRSWTCDAGWRARLSALLGPGEYRTAPLAGSDRPVTTVAGKAGLWRETGAAAVDMESHAAAAAAASALVPFAALRVVADPAGRAVPRAALAGVTQDGASRPAAVIGSLILRPWETVGVVRLALDARVAAGSLRRVALRAAPLFALG